MISLDLLVSIVVMSLFFLRHTAVYKDPNKINYTPVVLALGIIGGLLHFILSGGMDANVVKESLLSFGFGITLSAIMSVMSQTVATINTHEYRIRFGTLIDEMTSVASVL
jgi:hypothetical protein